MFKKSILFFIRPLLKSYVYTVRHGLAKGLKRKGGLGFIPSMVIPLTREEKFLMGLDLNNCTVYDIGGNEGAFTLFFARAVGERGKVITFEPLSNSFNKILQNVKLNNFCNVEVFQIGLGKKREAITLAFRPLDLGTASIQKDIKAQILREKGAKTLKVEIYPLDDVIITNYLSKPDFIKIDVEGLEMDVLFGMSETIKNFKPKLFIEIHGYDTQSKIKNVQEIVKFLAAKRYSLQHVESGGMINSSNFRIAKEGHLYCI